MGINMKILYICGREPSYVRNSVILKGLKLQKDVELLEYTSNAKSYFKRYISVFKKYLLKYSSYCDIIYVGFLGQPIVPVVRALSKKPIIFDAFISIYDTLCYDRKVFRPNSIMGKLSYYLDRVSCDLADVVLLDTNAHINYFVDTFKLDKDKFKRVFVGADDTIFYPRDVDKDDDGKFRVFYYGTYLPLHGIEYIVKSAKILESYGDIVFKMVGKGLEYEKIINLAKRLNIKNIEFIDWVPYEKLPLEIAKADV